jgi:hypothetical protein
MKRGDLGDIIRHSFEVYRNLTNLHVHMNEDINNNHNVMTFDEYQNFIASIRGGYTGKVKEDIKEEFDNILNRMNNLYK